MSPILDKADFFLLDFDGFLANTEYLHYRAYQRALEQIGCQLILSFDDYIQIALAGSQAIKKVIDDQCPQLEEKGYTWEKIYALKKQMLLQIVQEEPLKLMPGVPRLLQFLESKGNPASVVTNSPRVLIDLVVEKQPVLKQIPYWITREDYEKPKPDPECYRLAMKRYCQPEFVVVGFEDSPKGMHSLIAAGAVAVMVCPYKHIASDFFEQRGCRRFYSLEEVFSK